MVSWCIEKRNMVILKRAILVFLKNVIVLNMLELGRFEIMNETPFVLTDEWKMNV